MSNKKNALEILEEAKHALNKLGALIKELEHEIGETPSAPAALEDDPPGGNNPSAPDIP